MGDKEKYRMTGMGCTICKITEQILTLIVACPTRSWFGFNFQNQAIHTSTRKCGRGAGWKPGCIPAYPCPSL